MFIDIENPRKRSKTLTAQDASIVKGLIGYFQFFNSRVAALFDVNQGRISEIRTGKKFFHIDPATQDECIAFLKQNNIQI